VYVYAVTTAGTATLEGAEIIRIPDLVAGIAVDTGTEVEKGIETEATIAATGTDTTPVVLEAVAVTA